MVEARGDFGRDDGLRQHLGEIEQEVVVVEHVLALFGFDVRGEERAKRVLVRRDPGKPFSDRLAQVAARVDDARIDGEACPLGGKALLRLGEAGLVPRPVHQIRRILAVVDGELLIEAKARRIFAQEPRADRMKRARICGRSRRRGFRRKAAGEQPLDAPAELGCGAARKGRQHDALRIGAGKDQRRDPVGQHRRLAGAGAGDDEQRPGAGRLADPMLDREHLLGVEFGCGRRTNQGERHGPNATMFRALFARAVGATVASKY